MSPDTVECVLLQPLEWVEGNVKDIEVGQATESVIVDGSYSVVGEPKND